MKFAHSNLVLFGSSALALSVPRDPASTTAQTLFTVETAPGKTIQITEAEKWELKKVRHRASVSLGITELNHV